ncbi:hypothetical protein Tco_0299127 [Tanacetum coccineum]
MTHLEAVLLYLELLYYEVMPPDIFPLRHIFGGVTPEDNVVLGETSISFSLQVVYSRVQRVKGEIMEKRLSLIDVMAPLAEPLSSRSLIGE